MERVLAEHAGITDAICSDVAWVQATSEYAGESGRRVRVATVTDAVTAGGKSRAQAATQLARAAHLVTEVNTDDVRDRGRDRCRFAIPDRR